jgi:hypothetical protein
MALECDGQYLKLEHGNAYGQPDLFARRVAEQVALF